MPRLDDDDFDQYWSDAVESSTLEAHTASIEIQTIDNLATLTIPQYPLPSGFAEIPLLISALSGIIEPWLYLSGLLPELFDPMMQPVTGRLIEPGDRDSLCSRLTNDCSRFVEMNLRLAWRDDKLSLEIWNRG